MLDATKKLPDEKIGKFQDLTDFTHRNQSMEVNRGWLLPSFLLDVFRQTGKDKPVFVVKNLLSYSTKQGTKVEKRIHISG